MAGTDTLTQPVRRVLLAGIDHQDRLGPARRLLVEAAWHHLRELRIGATLAHRSRPARHIPGIANEAQRRLHRVGRRMRSRGKPHNVTTVTIAREVACFLWAAATAD